MEELQIETIQYLNFKTNIYKKSNPESLNEFSQQK